MREEKTIKKVPQGLAGIFQKDRPQEILTPDFILQPLKNVWGEIKLDPAGSKLNTFAEKTIFENENGLTTEWVDKTYINPPFKTLKEWMEKMSGEIDGKKNIVMLCPVRSHRGWWRKLAGECLIVLLPQMAFRFYKQKFPVPMCLLVSGEKAKEISTEFQDSLILTINSI